MNGRRNSQSALGVSAGWLREEYAHGRSHADLADELGVSSSTVSKWLRAEGVKSRTPAEAAALRRPKGLNDEVWLRERYVSRSVRAIAAELGVNEQRVRAALRRLSISTRGRGESLRRRCPPLHHAEWLQRSVENSSVREVAEDLGVSRAAVTTAMARLGVGSPHRYVGPGGIDRPSDELLVELWGVHGTVSGVAKQCEVSPTAARVWLAVAGCFVNDEPALTKDDLEPAIAAGESLRTIGRRFKVTDSTVLVELHRHRLFSQHRRRHLPFVAAAHESGQH